MAEVIATKQGYYGKLREPGEKFDVPDDLKATWFASADKADAAFPGTDDHRTVEDVDAEIKALNKRKPRTDKTRADDLV